MCGIAGILERSGQPVEQATLERMTAVMRHRGPDSDGFHIEPPVGIAMRRLEVIDLATGDQPIASADGRLQIVFNGEIYNYRELRAELSQRGCSFATESDTEVLLQMYREHGLAMLDRLNGMYAFAVWDRDRQELVIARDRVGIKPLYYADTGERFVFASEITALNASRLVARTIDSRLVPALLTLQYLPGPRTLFKGIKKLAPGACLRVTTGGTELIEPAPQPVQVETPADRHELSARLRSTLASAVRYRMIADVPLGAFLSGGIDSSILVGLMAAESSRPVQTFSVGFETEGCFDELAQARLVADHFATDHHELVFSSRDLVAGFADALSFLDDPIIDPATLPTRLIAGLARRHVTVALSGEGADELLGGYNRYRYQHLLGRLPRLLWRLVPVAGGHRVRQALEALAEPDPLANHLAWSRVTADSVVTRLLDPEAVASSQQYIRSRLGAHITPDTDPVTAAMQADQRFWLVDDLLTKVDRMSMACSLEARVPYLDTRMVDLANSIPLRYKLAWSRGKQILRDAFADLVPPAILKRRKQGFDLPLSEWFRTSLQSFLLDRLAMLEDDPVVSYPVVQQITDDHMQGRESYPVLLFGLLVYSHLAGSKA
jgi:asparagine synthase (glutamine-hydrolysing)